MTKNYHRHRQGCQQQRGGTSCFGSQQRHLHPAPPQKKVPRYAIRPVPCICAPLVWYSGSRTASSLAGFRRRHVPDRKERISWQNIRMMDFKINDDILCRLATRALLSSPASSDFLQKYASPTPLGGRLGWKSWLAPQRVYQLLRKALNPKMHKWMKQCFLNTYWDSQRNHLSICTKEDFEHTNINPLQVQVKG
jgi:hypothetical protein